MGFSHNCSLKPIHWKCVFYLSHGCFERIWWIQDSKPSSWGKSEYLRGIVDWAACIWWHIILYYIYICIIYIRTYIHTYVRTYIHTYIYIYICTSKIIYCIRIHIMYHILGGTTLMFNQHPCPPMAPKSGRRHWQGPGPDGCNTCRSEKCLEFISNFTKHDGN